MENTEDQKQKLFKTIMQCPWMRAEPKLYFQKKLKCRIEYGNGRNEEVDAKTDPKLLNQKIQDYYAAESIKEGFEESTWSASIIFYSVETSYLKK